MFVSKEKLLVAYYYIALIAFAVSACAVMFYEESDGGGIYRSVMISFTLICWGVFILRPLSRGYLIEKPSKTILFFNIYLFWALCITLVFPVGEITLVSYVISFFWSFLPLLILNTTYYYVLHKGDSVFLKMTFFAMTVMFLLTYYSFYDVDNILLNVHLGSSYYSLYMLPLLLVCPFKIIRTLLIIIVCLAVFSSVKRGGVLALALALMAYIITNQYVTKHGKFTKIIIGVCVLVAFAAIFAYIGTLSDNNVFERFESIQEDGGSGRTDVWEEAWRLINSQDILHFIIGNGFNAVVHSSRYVLSAHNDYLEAWYDFGIAGMVLYVLSMMSLFKDIIVCIKVKRQYAPAMAALGSIILVLSMISHIAIYYWFNVVVLSIAYFEGCYDRDLKNND